MNKALINWWQGGASIDSDYQAWLTQIIADGGTEPSASVKTAQNALVVALKANSLWTRMKAGWFLHAGDVTTCRRNIASPSTFRLTIVGTTPTFSEGNGCKSADATSCFNTTYASNQYAGIQTDLTTFAYISDSSNPSSSGDLCGARSNTDFTLFRITPKSAAAAATHTRFEGSGVAHTNATMKGFYCDTYDGTNRVFYKSGVKTAASMTPTAPNIAAPFGLLARNSNGGSGFTISSPLPYFVSYFFMFNRFTDSDESTLRGLLTTYNTSAGLP